MPEIKLPPHMPPAMRRLPKDDVGRPIPKFVGVLNGKRDFRVADADWLMKATARKLCFTCGGKLPMAGTMKRDGYQGMFVVGPMCVVNNVSAEPPHHAACGKWSAMACPFMNNPNRVRREAGLPNSLAEGTPGVAIERNPGVTALVMSRQWTVDIQPRGLLYHFVPTDVQWVSQGREATAAEVLTSVEGGITALSDMCQLQLDEEGVDTFPALAEATNVMLSWLPRGGWNPDDYPNVAGVLSKA